jgi:hypothetical protein
MSMSAEEGLAVALSSSAIAGPIMSTIFEKARTSPPSAFWMRARQMALAV